MTFKAYRRNSSNMKFIEYKRSRAEARNILRRKKRKGFVRFESINRFTDMKYVWQKIRIFRFPKHRVD